MDHRKTKLYIPTYVKSRMNAQELKQIQQYQYAGGAKNSYFA